MVLQYVCNTFVMVRFILHADLDAFYASVEQLDNQDLLGKPVVVGGAPDARGVAAAASYEARKFGVRSAMPMARALRLCPEAVRIQPRFDRYRQVSQRVMSIFRSVTPLVEPLSLDEAYIDVSEDASNIEDATAIARSIKAEVKSQTGLTVSVGVGATKSVAKIASDMGKPDGLTVVKPGTERGFLKPLPVRRLSGIGAKAEVVLQRNGIKTIGDLAEAEPAVVEQLIGSRGSSLVRLANGSDERRITTSRQRKSAGAETTFPRDIPFGPELREATNHLCKQVSDYLEGKSLLARTVTLKLRYSNFRTITRQATLEQPVQSFDRVSRVAISLLDKLEPTEPRFRLVGVLCSNWAVETHAQQHLLERDVE